MKKRLTKFAQVAGIMLALTLTYSCSGDNDDDGGGGGSCSLETLDGVWDIDGNKVTFSGSTGTVNGNQIYKELTSTGNLTWSGQERIDEEGVISWSGIQLTMSADGQKLTVLSLDPVLYGETITLTRKCNNQSGGGSSSPSGSSPSSGGNFNYGSVTDKGGKTYKTIKIGEQTWMAENLNYDVLGNDTDVCYDNDPAKCTKYGRLYDWETANTACPNGWRLPGNDEWDELKSYVERENDCSYCAGKYLKAKSGWNENGNGEDKFGFSALPGGNGSPYGFGNVGEGGYWWSASASEYLASLAYYRDMSYGNEGETYHDGVKDLLFSVRCIKDN
jgi:uncharacterized protein (TIGR02145 family)